MHYKYKLSQSFHLLRCQNPQLLFIVLNHITADIRSHKKNSCSCIKPSTCLQLHLYWLVQRKDFCVSLCMCVWPCPYMHMYTFRCLYSTHCTYMCVFMPVWASGCLCACPYAVTSAVTKETPWGGEEVPKGVRHGEERHVVHSLSLEKSLSEIHRLIQSPSRVREMSSPSLGATARWTLPLRRWGEISSRWSSQRCFLQPSRGFAFSLFRFQTQRENKTGG